ncbi:MAG: tetratricopeptide repeat protein [Gammaproteobacteria bacterium]
MTRSPPRRSSSKTSWSCPSPISAGPSPSPSPISASVSSSRAARPFSPSYARASCTRKRAMRRPSSARPCTGSGGVGKTRLAVEYAWRHDADYSALLFVVADSPENLRRNLAALVGPPVLDLPEQEATEEEKRVAAALRWLREHPGWFLILDNVDTPEAASAAEHLLARLRGGSVLITSRLAQWSASVEPLELDVLAPEDAAQFLLERNVATRRKRASDAQDAAALARELDGLALEQAGAYIANERTSLADYLAQWRAHVPAVQEWYDPRLMQYPRSLAVTWQTTIDQLGAGEIALLRLLAWLAPNPVPMFVLEGEAAEEIWREAIVLFRQESPESRKAAGELRAVLVRLANYSLLRWDTEAQTVAVHRVVQEILRTRLPEPRRREWLILSLRLLDAAATGDPQDVHTWPRWNPLQPHVVFIVVEADATGIGEPTTRLMSNLGLLLKTKALYAEAEPLYRRALAIDERSYGPEHSNVAIRLNNLALLLKDTDRLKEAEPLMRRALEIDERSYGPKHPRVATDLINLAQLLQATNRLEAAEPLMRRALEIDERSYGPEHPDVATDLNNLAQLLQATHRLEEAEPLVRRAVRILENPGGGPYPNYAGALNNLAALLQATNRLEEAEPLSRRVLAIVLDFSRRTGHPHPHLDAALANYAGILKGRGRSEADIAAELGPLSGEYGVELRK